MPPEEVVNMASGGARNRSGPPADPTSGRSDRRGYKLTALPAAGYPDEAPEFPLPRVTRFNEIYEDGKKRRESDAGATEIFRDRELEVWAESWRTPQACAWSMERWRWQTVAEFCRLKVVVEMEPDANAALVSQLHRYRDQIGFTPAGMRDNGWAIAHDEVTPKREEQGAKPASSRARLASVKTNGA